MTVRYVGPGGNDANSGLTWALRKLTLNGVEDTPVVAGDLVYVGPGTYRETLTVDVSGTAGNAIEYRADYLGTNTDGVGGVVRITGSDDDIALTRANCIDCNGKNYRTFTGFSMDTASAEIVKGATATTNWTITGCFVVGGNAFIIDFNGITSNHTIQNSVFIASHSGGVAIRFNHSSTTTSTGSLVQNCLFIGGISHLITQRVAGITVRNCVHLHSRTNAIQVSTALAGGASITVNNCIFSGCSVALVATVAGEIVENYNTFFNNGTNRTNTNIGANSLVYPPLFDPRWLFQALFAGAGPNSPFQLASPFDLASYSALLNVAGTSPTTTDLRGTVVQGAAREWGVAEYDSTLKIRGGIKKSRIRIGQ